MAMSIAGQRGPPSALEFFACPYSVHEGKPGVQGSKHAPWSGRASALRGWAYPPSRLGTLSIRKVSI